MKSQRPTAPNHRGTLRRLEVFLALLFIGALAQVGRAQGTSGTLPPPISAREIIDFAKRLKLSEQQQKAAETLHDQYKQEFRIFREGEIASFLKEMHNLQGNGMSMPKRADVEDFVKKMELLNGKIASLDNRYFDQLQSVLTDDQLGMMTRVRQARQRTRFAASDMMMMTRNHNVDLSEIAMELELPPDQWQLADSILGPYEAKLTSDLGKLHEYSLKMILDMMDAFEKQGINEETMNSPDGQQKMMETMQNVWRDIMKKPMETAGQISDLNRRTYRSVAAVVPPETARTLRNNFYVKAYAEAGFALGANEPALTAALKLPDLTDEQRQTVTVAKDDYLRRMDKILEDAVTLIEANQRDQSPFDMNAEQMQQYAQKLADLRTKADELTKATSEALTLALGPELTAKVQAQAPAKPTQVLQGAVAAQMAEAVAAVQQDASAAGPNADPDEIEQQMWSGDQFLPSRIGKADVLDYTGRLHLTEDQRPLIQQLHKTYVEKFKLLRDTEIAALLKASQAMWSYDQATQTSTGPTMDKIEDVHRLRRLALDAIRRTDAAFFDDLEMMLEPDQVPLMKQVRLARERAIYNRGQNMGFYFGQGSNESGIDLSTLVRQQRLDDAVLKTLAPELLNYEEAVTVAFRTKYEVAMDMERAQQRWQAEMTKAQAEGGGNPMSFATKYREIMGEITKKSTQASAQIGKLNRESLDRILAGLSADAAYNLRSEYNRRAFPNVYQDETALDRQLNEALKLNDLTDDQRRKIADLAAEYRPAYAGFCDQLVQNSTGSEDVNLMSGDPQDMKKFQERQEKMATVKFDRNEVNVRAISQLKSILTEDQIRRVGGLPEPKQHDRSMPWDD